MNVSLGLAAAAVSAGVLSVFSPCILPLLPVYLGYFSGQEGEGRSSMAGRLGKTLAFVLGVSTVFVLMGVGAGLAGSFLQSRTFALVCGVAIVFMGVHQMGLIRIPLLERTRQFSSPVRPGSRGVVGAFALGFFFSFGWTPCVGPILATVLGVSLQQGDAVGGGLLLLCYVAGFAVPFLLLAAGSQLLLDKVRGLYPHLNKVRVAGGVLVVAMGIWMIAGQGPALTAPAPTPTQTQETAQSSPAPAGNTLSGAQVSLEDWAGKTVYLKFWATWCPACVSGIQEFSRLAQEYADREDVVIYSVVAPGVHNEMDRETFQQWAAGQGLTFPVLFDEDGQLGRQFGIRGYPTSVFLKPDQEVAVLHIGHMSNQDIQSKLQQLTQKTEGSK